MAEGNPIEATHRWVLHLARILPDRRLGWSFHRGHVSFGEAEGRPGEKVFCEQIRCQLTVFEHQPKMSHLNFLILGMSTNICPFKIDLSGNTI